MRYSRRYSSVFRRILIPGILRWLKISLILKKMITNVFIRNLKAYKSGKRLIINQGGQGSSKTYSILQDIYGICLEKKARRITFCSYALPHLKQGAMADWENLLKFFGVNTSFFIPCRPSSFLFSFRPSYLS